MDFHSAMMQASCLFDEVVSVFVPVFEIPKQVFQILWNRMPLDAYVVAIFMSRFACPFPNFTKHFLVESQTPTVVEWGAARRRSIDEVFFGCLSNVLCLYAIQFGSRRNAPNSQPR